MILLIELLNKEVLFWPAYFTQFLTGNLKISNNYNDKPLGYPIQAKTSKSGREYFRLGAESYSSIERVGKKKKKNGVSTFGRFRLWTSSESSPVSVNGLILL